MARRLGPAKPRGSTWNGAGAWLIFSHARQVNFSRTYCSTFHCRGTTSSVSVTSSPSLASRVEPQQVQAVGPGTTIRSRGRCSGKGLRDGFLRVNERNRRARGRRRLLGGELVLRRRRFELLEFQLHLVEKPRACVRCAGRKPRAASSRWSAADARSEPRRSTPRHAPAQARHRVHGADASASRHHRAEIIGGSSAMDRSTR